MKLINVNMVVFFFKQKTAYEMLRSLVGSEMCIRDSVKLGVFARGGRQGAEVELELDAVKLWRLSDEEVRKGKRSG